jgi:hypothetical protein
MASEFKIKSEQHTNTDEALALAMQEEENEMYHSIKQGDAILAEQLSAWGGASAEDDDMESILAQIAEMDSQITEIDGNYSYQTSRQPHQVNTSDTSDNSHNSDTSDNGDLFAGVMIKERERERQIRKRIEQEAEQQARTELLRQQDLEYEQSLIEDQKKEDQKKEEMKTRITTADVDTEPPLSPASIRRARLAHFATIPKKN